MDPRLAALYDLDNPPGQDHHWFRTLASRIDARTVVDLGCGTGSLTVTLTGDGRRVVGIDPDENMLAVARGRQGAESVEWVLGTSTSIGPTTADLVIMSGNVAQHIGSGDWERTLADIHHALRPGGRLAFESRNPLDRAWLGWTRDMTLGSRDTATGRLTEWMEVFDVSGPAVTFQAHNLFDATGEEVVLTQTLTFRTLAEITDDLAAAGLQLDRVFGGWAGEPLTESSRLLVVEASRPADPGPSSAGQPLGCRA